VQLSLDGAQLYQDKDSDCWIFVYIIHNLAPELRYHKKFVIPAGFIPGPEKMKDGDSFLYPVLHHISALQNEGLRIWDASTSNSYPPLDAICFRDCRWPCDGYGLGYGRTQWKIWLSAALWSPWSPSRERQPLLSCAAETY